MIKIKINYEIQWIWPFKEYTFFLVRLVKLPCAWNLNICSNHAHLSKNIQENKFSSSVEQELVVIMMTQETMLQALQILICLFH